jgi:hypothetical protein
MALKKTPPQSVQVRVLPNSIQVPDVEPGERLTRAQHEAWALWAREVINDENVEAEIEPDVFIAFLQWRKLMNDRAFYLVPMNSAEFRTSLAGRLPPNDRRRIVELAGLTIAEGMQVSFPEIVNAARRNTLQARTKDNPPKQRTKPRMTVQKVQEHWQEVLKSGNRNLIEEYLTLAETKLAKKIGCSRNTLRSVEAFQQRDTALREFNRQNR